MFGGLPTALSWCYGWQSTLGHWSPHASLELIKMQTGSCSLIDKMDTGPNNVATHVRLSSVQLKQHHNKVVFWHENRYNVYWCISVFFLTARMADVALFPPLKNSAYWHRVKYVQYLEERMWTHPIQEVAGQEDHSQQTSWMPEKEGSTQTSI